MKLVECCIGEVGEGRGISIVALAGMWMIEECDRCREAEWNGFL